MIAEEARVRAVCAELADALVALAAATPEVADAPERLYDVGSAAAALSIGRSALYTELQSGRLRSLSIGRRRLIPASAIAAYIGLADAAGSLPVARSRPSVSDRKRPVRVTETSRTGRGGRDAARPSRSA